MTIGINGNEANVPHRVGSGQYAYELLSHLATLNFSTFEPEFRTYLASKPLSDMPPVSDNWSYEVFSGKLWTLNGLQRKLLAEKVSGKIPDVFFTPSHYTPLYLPIPSVISIMDMSFETLPEYFKGRDLYQLKYWTRVSAMKAKRILTISEFSKKEICRIYQFPSEKVVVTLLGYDEKRFNPQIRSQSQGTKLHAILKKYKISQPYFMFLGTFQPKKNITRLVEAFAELNRPDLQLVMTGMTTEGRGGWLYEQFLEKVKGLGLEKQVVFTGFVPDEDVPYLYGGSLALVLPSLYEGFGIPPIEAMATGTPVVVSRVASLPEICGESAFYIDDPYSILSIKGTLEEILKGPPGKLESKTKVGLQWVKRYNWEMTARGTIETLHEAI